MLSSACDRALRHEATIAHERTRLYLHGLDAQRISHPLRPVICSGRREVFIVLQLIQRADRPKHNQPPDRARIEMLTKYMDKSSE